MVEQVIRPTGLDRPGRPDRAARGQVPASWPRSGSGAPRGERILVTTPTKRLAEDLSRIHDGGRRGAASGCTLNSSAIERMTILRGVPRRGIRHPDRRQPASPKAETCPRSRWSASSMPTRRLPPKRNLADPDDRSRARHINAEVVLCADKVTDFDAAPDETTAGGPFKLAYNTEHGITPESIVGRSAAVSRRNQAKVETRNAVGRDEMTAATEEYLNGARGRDARRGREPRGARACGGPAGPNPSAQVVQPRRRPCPPDRLGSGHQRRAKAGPRPGPAAAEKPKAN